MQPAVSYYQLIRKSDTKLKLEQKPDFDFIILGIVDHELHGFLSNEKIGSSGSRSIKSGTIDTNSLPLDIVKLLSTVSSYTFVQPNLIKFL